MRAYLSSKDFIQCAGTSQDDVGVVHLNHTLTQSDEVGTNTNCTTGDLQGEGQEGEGQEGEEGQEVRGRNKRERRGKRGEREGGAGGGGAGGE